MLKLYWQIHKCHSPCQAREGAAVNDAASAGAKPSGYTKWKRSCLVLLFSTILILWDTLIQNSFFKIIQKNNLG